MKVFQKELKNKGFDFSLISDYTDTLKEQGFKLGFDEYINLNNSRERLHIEEFIFLITQYIEGYVPSEIKELDGFDIKIKVKETKRGSIEFLGTIILGTLGTYYGISRYKNFIESIELINTHIRFLVQKFLNVEFPRHFKVIFNNPPIIIETEGRNSPLLWALIGVVIGGLITGFFSITNRLIDNRHQLEMFSKQQTITEINELKNSVVEYSNVISHYIDLMTEINLDSNKVDYFYKNIFRTAYNLSLMSQSDLGTKTFQLNEITLRHLQNKIKSGTRSNKDINEFTKAFVNWTILAKSELKHLKNSAMPEILEQNLLQLQMD